MMEGLDIRRCNKCAKSFAANSNYVEGHCPRCRKLLKALMDAFKRVRPKCPRCTHRLVLNEYYDLSCSHCGERPPIEIIPLT